MYQTFENTVLREDDVDEDLHVLLMGKTGSGKSATGNLIFNDRVFESEMRSSSVTRICQAHTGPVNNKRVKVIDTPDFRFSTHTNFDSDSELKKAVELCSPGAHVILLILSLSTFTQQEQDFIAWFEQRFGVEALRFTLVLFTHAGQRHMRSVGEMIRGNTQLADFIHRCGQRYHEFNLKDPSNRQQVNELMEKIVRLVFENRNSRYTLEMMLEIERRREEEKKAEEERREREHQETLEIARRETETRVRREIMEKQEKEKREEEKRERVHQVTLEIARRETETRVRREILEKERRETERDRTEVRVREEYETGKRKKHPFFKQMKLKYGCVFMVFAAVTGGVMSWKTDSLHGWTFMRGFLTGGSAAAAGVLTGIFWRLMMKSPLICSGSQEGQSYRQLLLMSAGVMCGLLAGAVIGHFLGGNEVPATVLAGLGGAAGAFTAIQ